MDTQRLILFFIFGFSLLMLWDAWEKENRPKPAPQAPPAPRSSAGADAKPGARPRGAPAAPRRRRADAFPARPRRAAKGEIVRCAPTWSIAEIDTLGATLKRVELLQAQGTQGLRPRTWCCSAPSTTTRRKAGLTGEGGPNHRTLWSAQPGERALAAGQEALEVRFTAQGKDGLAVHQDLHLQARQLRDRRRAGDQERRRRAAGAVRLFPAHPRRQAGGDANTVAETFGAQSFNGFAVYTDEKKFQKVTSTDVDKGKADYVKQATNGWLAFVQHYFVAGWLPPRQGMARDYVLEKREDGLYAGRVLVPVGTIAPGASATVTVPLYAGPQEQSRLQAAAPGFDLVVDYGWLAIIAWPLFWLLEKFHALSGNWGVAIILLTVLIKLVFFPLSAASYKSMAKMKLITPRLTKIREMYAHDRQKMNQAMMELYKTEKINPLGGCFPILVQIPVFIALYWVLLAAIELRHAPFMLWIKDLSALDPYYVLPILMTVTMVMQTQAEPGAARSGAGEGDAVHAVRLQHLLLLLPGRAGALLAGQQHPFHRSAMADPAHVRPRQACPCQAVT